MASYTYTCEACGARMSVDERYWGRTLRCRSCRAPFAADPAAAVAGARSMAHTCTACGAVMAVPARYAGRTLSCTSCGEPFVARIPVSGAEAAELPSAPSETSIDVPLEPPWMPHPPARRRWLPWALVVVGGLAFFAALLWWLGGERDTGPGSFLFAVEKQRTQIGRLGIDRADAVPVALDREAFDELAKAAASKDAGSLEAFRESPRYLWLPAGTQVRVLERRRGREARVRILDGPESSRIVWVPITWVR